MSTILVIANETVESPILREAIGATAKGGDDAEVVIVAPALNSRARHWSRTRTRHGSGRSCVSSAASRR